MTEIVWLVIISLGVTIALIAQINVFYGGKND